MADQFADLVHALGDSDALRDRQLARERTQREAATGVRARGVLRGDLGPVLKRWVTASILPVAGRMRALCEALLTGDSEGAAALASSPVFGLPDFAATSDLHVACRWALKGDHLNDLVLTVMGEAITSLAVDGKVTPLTRVLTQCGGKARETALGQFLTQVQGAKTMLRVRGKGKAQWQQSKQMDAIAALMAGQVRTALDAIEELPVRGKVVVSVRTPAGEARRIDLRPPEADDWDLLNVARHVKGEKDAHLGTWCSFAMLVLCCAQAEAGWFDLVKVGRASTTRGRNHRRAAHGLVLSDSAHAGIKRDIDKWLHLGFIKEPMLCEPEDGDYLSVKHRTVAGGRGPMGAKTEPGGTTAWEVASDVMGRTGWTVPAATLRALRESPFVQVLAERAEPDDARRASILAGYRRLATEDAFYIPLFMDFRGRVYTRSSAVTYQGRDLQKAMLCFPRLWRHVEPGPHSSTIRATVLHASALYGNGLDKAPLHERLEWWASDEVEFARVYATSGMWDGRELQDLLSKAEEPLQLLTALTLQAPGQGDRLACQIDGTCNGLQHLSALFRDETAAPFVNLVGSSLSDRPADIYAEVAKRVASLLEASGETWARRVRGAVKIDRKLCKKPVMVLPYGGTKATIEDAVLEAILDQEPDAFNWTHGVLPGGAERGILWEDWAEGSYGAFRERDLKDHPLLHLDARKLGSMVYDAIRSILPRPMAAMQAFRDIAKQVGPRTLEWSTGVGEHPLWVVQAKAKSDAVPLHLKGLHLPGSVRGLLIRPGRDEVDAHAHVTGIVANFIHSMDAAHQTRTMQAFGGSGGRKCFGAIFDCYITRPSTMSLLGEAARVSFAQQYRMDPLSFPVRLRDVKGGGVEEFPSWYALAEACGVEFPERGMWEPEEVLRSAWFFS